MRESTALPCSPVYSAQRRKFGLMAMENNQGKAVFLSDRIHFGIGLKLHMLIAKKTLGRFPFIVHRALMQTVAWDDMHMYRAGRQRETANRVQLLTTSFLCLPLSLNTKSTVDDVCYV